MQIDEAEDTTVYEVVVNHEEQYSIWPEYKGEPPLGWKKAGKAGLKPECLGFVNEVWKDMRPLSLRKKMEKDALNRPSDAGRAAGIASAEPADPRDDLVGFLSAGIHPVEVGLRPAKSLGLFKAAFDRGFVHIRFTGTRGGTELGVRLDERATKTDSADFQSGKGSVRLAGDLTLNYQQVRCYAEIDLETLSGTGRLEKMPA